MTWLPDFLKNLGSANYGMWNSPTPAIHPDGRITAGEGGVDISTPIGTPVYAIADGVIVGAGYWKDNAHGVVTTRVNVPGQGPQDLYYQHIQIAPGIREGQTVVRGQRIGTIGPFNEIEMGFNARWGQPWGTNHPGPWVKDPRPWISSLLTGNAPAYTDTSNTGTTGSSTPTGASPGTAWVDQLRGEGIKIGLFILALVLFGFGLYLIFTKQANELAKNTLKAAKVAAVA